MKTNRDQLMKLLKDFDQRLPEKEIRDQISTVISAAMDQSLNMLIAVAPRFSSEDLSVIRFSVYVHLLRKELGE